MKKKLLPFMLLTLPSFVTNFITRNETFPVQSRSLAAVFPSAVNESRYDILSEEILDISLPQNKEEMIEKLNQLDDFLKRSKVIGFDELDEQDKHTLVSLTKIIDLCINDANELEKYGGTQIARGIKLTFDAKEIINTPASVKSSNIISDQESNQVPSPDDDELPIDPPQIISKEEKDPVQCENEKRLSSIEETLVSQQKTMQDIMNLITLQQKEMLNLFEVFIQNRPSSIFSSQTSHSPSFYFPYFMNQQQPIQQTYNIYNINHSFNPQNIQEKKLRQPLIYFPIENRSSQLTHSYHPTFNLDPSENAPFGDFGISTFTFGS